MKDIMRLLVALILAIGLFSGCVGEADSKPKVVTTEAIQEMNSTAFDATTGAVTNDTKIEAGNTGTTIAISEGTILQDTEGNTITKSPSAEVKTEIGIKKSTTTLNLEAEGKKVIPTEPVSMSIPAPTGAKAGDTVQIEVPDDGSITQKLILVVVQADGTVNVRIFPRAFRNTIVLVVIVQFDNSTN